MTANNKNIGYQITETVLVLKNREDKQDSEQ